LCIFVINILLDGIFYLKENITYLTLSGNVQPGFATGKNPDDDDKKRKRRNKIIIICLLSFAAIAGGCYIYYYYYAGGCIPPGVEPNSPPPTSIQSDDTSLNTENVHEGEGNSISTGDRSLADNSTRSKVSSISNDNSTRSQISSNIISNSTKANFTPDQLRIYNNMSVNLSKFKDLAELGHNNIHCRRHMYNVDIGRYVDILKYLTSVDKYINSSNLDSEDEIIIKFKYVRKEFIQLTKETLRHQSRECVN